MRVCKCVLSDAFLKVLCDQRLCSIVHETYNRESIMMIMLNSLYNYCCRPESTLK